MAVVRTLAAVLNPPWGSFSETRPDRAVRGGGAGLKGVVLDPGERLLLSQQAIKYTSPFSAPEAMLLIGCVLLGPIVSH